MVRIIIRLLQNQFEKGFRYRLFQFPLLLEALPTKTNVESGTSQSKRETSVNLRNSGYIRAQGFGFERWEVAGRTESEVGSSSDLGVRVWIPRVCFGTAEGEDQGLEPNPKTMVPIISLLQN